MGTIYTILNSLKIDQSFYVQFILFFVFFNTLGPLLFKRVQEVLDLREKKTVKLDSHANHTYKQAENIEEQYKGTLEKTHVDSQLIASQKKAEILAKEKALLLSAEEKMSNEYEERRKKMSETIASKKKETMATVDSLSNALVERLIK